MFFHNSSVLLRLFKPDFNASLEEEPVCRRLILIKLDFVVPE